MILFGEKPQSKNEELQKAPNSAEVHEHQNYPKNIKNFICGGSITNRREYDSNLFVFIWICCKIISKLDNRQVALANLNVILISTKFDTKMKHKFGTITISSNLSHYILNHFTTNIRSNSISLQTPKMYEGRLKNLKKIARNLSHFISQLHFVYRYALKRQDLKALERIKCLKLKC